MALFKFILVFASQTVYLSSSVKLMSHLLISLTELVKLSRNVIILEISDRSMLLKGVFFIKKLNIVISHLGVGELVVVEVFSNRVHLVFLVF